MSVSDQQGTIEVELAAAGAVPETRFRVPAVVTSLGRAVFVCCLVVVLTFLLVRAVPGNPVVAISGPHSTAAAREALLRALHLNGSLLSQFTSYIGGLLRGDLGNSLTEQPGASVISIVGNVLPVTLSLVLVTMIFSVLIGIPIGLIAAIRGGFLDSLLRAGFTLLLALPPFFLGLILILFAAVQVGLLPAGGWGSGWPGNIEYTILPSAALSGFMLPLVARATRQAAVDALAQPWAEAAVARGLSTGRIAFRHLLPNSLLPVVTLLGYQAGSLVAGAVVVEAVFGVPGIGQTLVNAVNLRDYPLIQGIALVSALAVVVSNLLAELLYRWADPRTRSR